MVVRKKSQTEGYLDVISGKTSKKSIFKKKKNKNKMLERIALIDTEIILFNVCMDALQEYKNQDDEWTYKVNELDARDFMKQRIQQMIVETKSDRCILFFGGKSNWRKKVLPEYKANRSQKKPLGYMALKGWLEEEYASQSRPFLEADDLIGVVHTTKKSNRETVIVSADKDFKCIPGLLYNPNHPEDGIVSVTKVQADNWHILQTLKGDSTDNYKGCPSVGEVGAMKVINNTSLSYKQKWKEVFALFEKAGLGKSEVLIQARVARICRKENYNMKTGKLKLWDFP